MAASMWSILLIISTSSLVSSTLAKMPTSTISAAPALHPTIPPLTSPSPAALSPDMNPLFPSPSGDGLSPSENSLPIIPSSPSPPNPDDMAPFGPTDTAMSPSGSLPVSQASRLVGYIASSSYSSSIVVLCTSLAFWYGM